MSAHNSASNDFVLNHFVTCFSFRDSAQFNGLHVAACTNANIIQASAA